MVILSGGEPLLRPDIFSLAEKGVHLGLRMLLSTNGTLLTRDMAASLKKVGIARVSLSLDAPTASEHDDFRGLTGSFAATMNSGEILKSVGLPFQINSAVTPDNIQSIEALSDLALKMGAAAHHVFLLVPVGRALEMGADFLPAETYEKALIKLRRREDSLGLEFKATCAPQYNRISRQLALPLPPRSSRGCLGGQGFMFISHDGRVCACGYLPLSAGDVRENHPIEIYENSSLFQSLRNKELYRGRCRDCEYWSICGGCRARAHAAGDYLGDEPLCPHQPQKSRPKAREQEDFDKMKKMV
jgi:radical SAM protein with 4Fe4S-binding SPASM domain